jgi:altronate hydrolase
MKQVVLKIHPEDNVLVALKNLAKADTISFEGEEYILQDAIGAKHKFFTRDMNQGDEVIMYGVLVGKFKIPFPGRSYDNGQRKTCGTPL